jgi:hypothetical protein
MKILPLHTPFNRYHFVDDQYNLGEAEALTPHISVYTSALRFNVNIPFTGLARSEELVAQEVIRSSWGIDPTNPRLYGVVFKLPDCEKVVTSAIGLNVADARFAPSSQTDFCQLAIENKRIPFVIGLTELATWTTVESRPPILQRMMAEQMYVRLEMELSGTLNIKSGNLRVLQLTPVHVSAVLDRKGRQLDLEADEFVTSLVAYFTQAEPIGFWMDADWLELQPQVSYQFEMEDACSAGRGLALLAKGVVGAYDCTGYAADVCEPTESAYGTTTVYLDTPDGKPRWKVVIEEGFDLQPGWVNVEFFGQAGELLKLSSIARFEKIPQVYVGQWAGAIGMFLVDGDSHRVNLTLPAMVPDHTTWAEIEKNPEAFSIELHRTRKFQTTE